MKDGDIEIKMGGVMTAEGSIVGQSKKFDHKPDGLSSNVSEAKIFFEGAYKDESGTKIGYVMRFNHEQAKVNETKIHNLVDRMYFKIENSNWGTVHVGQNKDVCFMIGKLAQKNMPTVWLRAPVYEGHMETYGIYKGSAFLNDNSISFKLNYLSPEINGWQFAASYAPFDNVHGDQPRNAAQGTNFTTLLALYKGKVDDVKFAITGSCLLKGDEYINKKHAGSSAAYLLSGSLGVSKWSAAFEFFGDVKHEEKAFNLSVKCEINEKNQLGLGFHNVWGAKNRRVIGTLGHNYQINENLAWSTQVDLALHQKGEGVDKKNEAFLIVTGLRAEF